MVTGGLVAGVVSADVQQYDPSTNAWTAKTALPATRYYHGQSTLDDGTVLVTGGRVGGSTASADVRSYDPSTNAWTIETALPATRSQHKQSTLNDGTVLVTGGLVGGNTVSADVRSYTPASTAPTPGRATLLGYLAAN